MHGWIYVLVERQIQIFYLCTLTFSIVLDVLNVILSVILKMQVAMKVICFMLINVYIVCPEFEIESYFGFCLTYHMHKIIITFMATCIFKINYL